MAGNAKLADCMICRREFARLKFVTEHIKICARCVSTLNDFSEPAIHAQHRLGELLANGMQRNALRDLQSSEEWKRNKARMTLDDFVAAHEKALPGWLNRLLADEANHTRDFKALRAYRRGLLRLEGKGPWSYPNNWTKTAALTRSRAGHKCSACGAMDVMLDVHHIIYLSNYGTNQQGNLVVLCRPCHEAEHGRSFDVGETDDPESSDPICPKPARTAPREPAAPWFQEPSLPLANHITPLVVAGNQVNIECPKCGGTYRKVFGLSTGDVSKCTACGFMPSRQRIASQVVSHELAEDLSEGGYALMQHASNPDPTPDSDTKVPRSRTPKQRVEPLRDETKLAPSSAGKPKLMAPFVVILVWAALTTLVTLLAR